LAGLLVLYVLVAAPWPQLGCDEAAWATSAVKVLNGKVLGRDAMMAKGPYLLGWHLLVYVATGPNVMALHLIGAAWALLTGVVVCLLALRFAGRTAMLATGLLYVAAVADPAVRANVYAEIIMALPLALGMIALAAGLNRGSFALVAAAGFCAGLAVLTKQTAAFSALAMAVVVALTHCFAAGSGGYPRLRRGCGALRRIARDWLALLAGGLLAALPWLVYVWQHRAGAGFMEDYVTTPTQYVAAMDTPQLLANVAWSLAHVAPRYTFVLLASVAGLGYLLKKVQTPGTHACGVGATGEKHEGDGAEAIFYLALCAWYLSALLGVAVTGRFAAHYFSQLFPPAALLGGIWIADRLRDSTPGRLNIGALVLGAQVLVLVPVGVMNLGYWRNATAVTAAGSPWRQVGEYVRDNTDPQETVFVWGDQTEVLYWAGRELASDQPWVTVQLLGFTHNRPVFASRITAQIDWQRLRDELDRWQPAYVVVAPVIQTVELPLGEQFGTAQLPELRAILNRRYSYQTTIAGYELYARRAARRPDGTLN